MNGADIWFVCGVGVLCAITLLCVRSMKPEIAGVMRPVFCVLFGAMLIRAVMPITAFLRTMSDGAAAEYTAVLIRALGVAWLTGLCADVCRDCGEAGVASGVEALGKLEILTLCLPLISSVLETVKEVLSW